MEKRLDQMARLKDKARQKRHKVCFKICELAAVSDPLALEQDLHPSIQDDYSEIDSSYTLTLNITLTFF